MERRGFERAMKRLPERAQREQMNLAYLKSPEKLAL